MSKSLIRVGSQQNGENSKDGKIIAIAINNENIHFFIPRGIKMSKDLTNYCTRLYAEQKKQEATEIEYQRWRNAVLNSAHAIGYIDQR